MKNDMTADEWLERGDALYRLDKYKEALHALNKAIEINPQFA